MKCKYCGYESELSFNHCPYCGAAAQKDAPSPTATPNPYTYSETYGEQNESQISKAVKDSLFFTICILSTVCCALTFLSGSIPLIRIILTIYLWKTYNQGKCNNLDANDIRNISGTVFASYVLNYIGAFFTVIGGVLFSALFNFIKSDAAILDEFYITLREMSHEVFEESISPILGETINPDIIFNVAKYIVEFAGLIGTGIVVYGVISALINFFGRRSIHKFFKSLYMSVGIPDRKLEKVGAAKAWMIVFSVFYIFSAVYSLTAGGFLPALANISFAVLLILTTVLINKYFSKKQ